MLNGLSAKLKDEAHYISKEKKLTALSKEVESLWVYGWWARHEMLKTRKCSLHKERRKGINRLEFAKFIETHLLEWQKRNLEMDWISYKFFDSEPKKKLVWDIIRVGVQG